MRAKYIVLAGNQRQFLDFCMRLADEGKIQNTRDCFYVSRVELLAGVRNEGQEVHVVGTASDRKDYDELMNTLNSCGFHDTEMKYHG